ncbi:hypothetical protein SCOR_27495 [Sulfidibacter corallicola]|uniref:Uncharacterized protein n=1 Tax=Sulfidibacter corallicola TaxID=2818388 RepID=A0A8A4TL21_SULCO|nr:hypothetical protein [Sulfidibacter corallicola]QTD50699.1 hypothetical protein J3U87_34365 [Sulfidibacter corallicola]
MIRPRKIQLIHTQLRATQNGATLNYLILESDQAAKTHMATTQCGGYRRGNRVYPFNWDPRTIQLLETQEANSVFSEITIQNRTYLTSPLLCLGEFSGGIREAANIRFLERLGFLNPPAKNDNDPRLKIYWHPFEERGDRIGQHNPDSDIRKPLFKAYWGQNTVQVFIEQGLAETHGLYCLHDSPVFDDSLLAEIAGEWEREDFQWISEAIERHLEHINPNLAKGWAAKTDSAAFHLYAQAKEHTGLTYDATQTERGFCNTEIDQLANQIALSLT